MFAQIFWHTCDVVLLDIIQNLTYNTAAVAAVVSSQNKCRLCLAFEGGLPIICLPSQRKTLADSDKDPTTKDQACKPRRHDRENSVVTLLSGETSVSPTIFKKQKKKHPLQVNNDKGVQIEQFQQLYYAPAHMR